jgi:hypothetical protein
MLEYMPVLGDWIKSHAGCPCSGPGGDVAAMSLLPHLSVPPSVDLQQ